MAQYVPPEKIEPPYRKSLAREAKALALLAFRHGPIENIHAGKRCPTCDGNPEYGHITNEQMKEIMKAAVSKLYTFLYLKELDPRRYKQSLEYASGFTLQWDDPEFAPFGEVHLGPDPEWLREFKESKRKEMVEDIAASGDKMQAVAAFFRSVQNLFIEIEQNERQIGEKLPTLYDAWLEAELLYSFLQESEAQ